MSFHFVESLLGEEESGKQNVDANNVTAARPDDGHFLKTFWDTFLKLFGHLVLGDLFWEDFQLIM